MAPWRPNFPHRRLYSGAVPHFFAHFEDLWNTWDDIKMDFLFFWPYLGLAHAYYTNSCLFWSIFSSLSKIQVVYTLDYSCETEFVWIINEKKKDFVLYLKFVMNFEQNNFSCLALWQKYSSPINWKRSFGISVNINIWQMLLE